MMEIEEQLREHDLRVTEIRKRLYQYFSDSKSAVSHAELEVIFSDDFDRVTIYRTLNSFLDKGILHKIPNDSGSAKYALCHAECDAEHHIDNHVHFKCKVCNNLICLHDMEIPALKLPQKYKVEHAVLLYDGICENCS